MTEYLWEITGKLFTLTLLSIMSQIKGRHANGQLALFGTK